MVRQGSAKPSFGGSIPPAAFLFLACGALLVGSAVAAAQADPDARGGQEPTQPWPADWFTDFPSIDLTGTWNFDPERSDPMLTVWQEKEVRYEINQHPTFIVLEFLVEGGRSNRQTYRWDGTLHRFERGERQVEEAARWTRGGRALEVRGRHWDPLSPDEIVEYGFLYEARGNTLTFTQENETGRTVWRFVRSRDE